MRYVEFRVRVEDGRNILAWQTNAPPIKAEVQYDALTSQTVEVLSKWLAEGRIQHRDELALLGSHLYGILFNGQVNQQFLDACGKADDETILRIVLEFLPEARHLATLPWEYLYLPDSKDRGKGFFVAARNKLILSRHVPLSLAAEVLRLKSNELRVLLVVSQPDYEVVEQIQDDVTVKVKRSMGTVEADKVVTLLEQLQKDSKGRIQLTQLHAPSKRSFIDELTRVNPHIVHVVGHGRYLNNVGSLAFVHPAVNNRSEVAWIPDSAFADCFLDSQPRLIILQACEGARSDSYEAFSGVALQLVYSRLPAVVAMQYPITNDVALQFARKLYQALAEGRPIDEAVQAGRRELGMYLDEQNFSSRAFGSPVVFLQSRDSSSLDGIIIEEQASVPAPTVTGTPAASRTLLCPRVGCATPVNPDRQYCPKCRGRYRICRNPNCGLAIAYEATFCDNCNTDVTADSPTTSAAAPSPLAAASTAPAGAGV